jgi:hypothetical protein
VPDGWVHALSQAVVASLGGDAASSGGGIGSVGGGGGGSGLGGVSKLVGGRRGEVARARASAGGGGADVTGYKPPRPQSAPPGHHPGMIPSAGGAGGGGAAVGGTAVPSTRASQVRKARHSLPFLGLHRYFTGRGSLTSPHILFSKSSHVEFRFFFFPNRSRLPEVFAVAGIHSDTWQGAACGRGPEQDAPRGEAPAGWEAGICPQQVACALELRAASSSSSSSRRSGCSSP